MIDRDLLTDASPRSKIALSLAVAASLAVWWYLPRWSLVALIVQVVASVWMLVEMKLRGDGGP